MNIKFLKFFYSFILSFLIFTSSSAKNFSDFFSNLIPGEGITEASIQINEDDNPDLEILAVRDIESSKNTNFFTQFSLHTQESNNHDRFIGNLGFGYRKLSDDRSNLFGFNVFLDNDFQAGHQRGSLGLELKGAFLDLTANSYHKLTNQQVYKGDKEQVLSGYTINLASQIPYAPWAKINWNNYSWDNEKAKQDTDGNAIALEAYLTPSVQFEIKNDMSNNSGIEDEVTYKLTYNYPPKSDGSSMQDGLSSIAFEKQDMTAKLKEKVKRDNNIVIEIQGSIIVTSK